MSPFWVFYRSMTSRFPPFAFVGLVSHIIKTTLHFGEKMWILCLTRSLCSLVTCCFCHLNIKFISSCHCVISSMYVCFRAFVVKPLTGTWELQSPDYHVLLCVKKIILWVKGDMYMKWKSWKNNKNIWKTKGQLCYNK